jgi:hypothetical protein
MSLTRRPASESDVPFLLQLRRQSMDRHLNATGTTTSESDHLARLRYRFDCAEVLLQEGHPVGLLKVSRHGQDWKIIQIQLISALQGRGFGASLLKQVIARSLGMVKTGRLFRFSSYLHCKAEASVLAYSSRSLPKPPQQVRI